jgi:hypothetical protein
MKSEIEHLKQISKCKQYKSLDFLFINKFSFYKQKDKRNDEEKTQIYRFSEKKISRFGIMSFSGVCCACLLA